MSVSLAKQITQLNTAHKPTVFVIALNSTQLLQRCQAQFEQAPYQALPKTPVIYVLPEATHNRSGANVSLSAGKKQLRIEPHLAVVFGRDTSRVCVEQAMHYVSGYLPVALYSLPYDSYYRPDIEGRCQEGFCVLGQEVLKSAVQNPAELTINITVNGSVKKSYVHLAMKHSIPELISFLSQFIAFKAGDILLTGTEDMPLLVGAGDQVSVEFAQLGCLTNTVTE
ncbi:fumarylacetoacetate hydrolase family protein [Pasteurella multocida]|uniref:fumarylacetoacetate hydrolase family protein n=1 Tax=Pasteurella multocida TaxID=747 RepID=UPI0028EF755C|nr:fumarylacetoacetate hydrolase family protein [Pasteurella multocida]